MRQFAEMFADGIAASDIAANAVDHPHIIIDEKRGNALEVIVMVALGRVLELELLDDANVLAPPPSKPKRVHCVVVVL